MKGFGLNFDSLPKKPEEDDGGVDVLEQKPENKKIEALKLKLQHLNELKERILEMHKDKKELPIEVQNFFQTLKTTEKEINDEIDKINK